MKRMIATIALTAAAAAPAFANTADSSTIFTEKEQEMMSTSSLTEGDAEMKDRDALLSAKEEARGVEKNGVFEVYSEGPGSEWEPFYPNNYQR